MIFAILLFAAIGYFVSWVSSILIYGFGELITNTAIIANNQNCENGYGNEEFYEGDDSEQDMSSEK